LPICARKKVSHTVRAKKLREHVGEINPRAQFHQRFSQAFFVQMKQNVTRKKDVRTKTRTKNVGEIDPWQECRQCAQSCCKPEEDWEILPWDV
jgi:hypothetical protein